MIATETSLKIWAKNIFLWKAALKVYSSHKLNSRIPCFNNAHSNLEVTIPLQCDISGAVLHLCHSVGTGTVHLVRNPVYSVFHPAQCHSMHLNRLNIFSTFK